MSRRIIRLYRNSVRKPLVRRQTGFFSIADVQRLRCVRLQAERHQEHSTHRYTNCAINRTALEALIRFCALFHGSLSTNNGHVLTQLTVAVLITLALRAFAK